MCGVLDTTTNSNQAVFVNMHTALVKATCYEPVCVIEGLALSETWWMQETLKAGSPSEPL